MDKFYTLKGALVEIITRWGKGGGPRNVLIEYPDGSRTVRPFRGLRKIKPDFQNSLCLCAFVVNPHDHHETHI